MLCATWMNGTERWVERSNMGCGPYSKAVNQRVKVHPEIIRFPDGGSWVIRDRVWLVVGMSIFSIKLGKLVSFHELVND